MRLRLAVGSTFMICRWKDTTTEYERQPGRQMIVRFAYLSPIAVFGKAPKSKTDAGRISIVANTESILKMSTTMATLTAQATKKREQMS